MRNQMLAGTWVVGLVAALALLLAGRPAFAQSHDHGMPSGLHVGNAAPYPKYRAASRANRGKARSLRLGTLRAAPRLDTVEEATLQGYVARADISPLYRPGLQHFRKRGPWFWGRVLNPWQPQALIFWCPLSGECRLAAFVYRAPRGMPPTYGGLLGWHRHRAHGSWMTHLWLTSDTVTALAQCAPFRALHLRDPMLQWVPYQPDVPMVDEPCPDTAGLH
jgi:hypothetical protein